MSDIKARRNSLLKSSISINSIRSSVTNFTKGLFSSRETASEIVNKTRESNVFKQRLISRDNILFRKRRENVKRREREDELEASGISGMIKRQGSVIAQSTKGFLGRILDFFGIILIGWFVTRLPKILDALGGLINRIKKVTGFLTNFVTGVTDFLFNFGLGIGQALQKLPKIDLLALNRKNQEELDLTNTNLVRVSNDFVDVGNQYNRGGQAISLKKVDGSDDLFDLANPEENKEKPNQTKTETETIPSDSVEGKPAEKITKFKADDTKLSLNSKKDDDGDELIKGIQNESEFKDIKSAQSREKGETIDNKNLENESKKDQDQEGKKTISDIKISAEKFFGNIAQQQTDVLKAETLDKKDNSSTISGVLSNIKQVLPDTEETDKKITPTPKNRTTVSRNFNKKRNQVIIMEKAVAMNNPPMSVGGGGKSNGLNNLGGFNVENEKRVIKNLQSVILNT